MVMLNPTQSFGSCLSFYAPIFFVESSGLLLGSMFSFLYLQAAGSPGGPNSNGALVDIQLGALGNANL